MKLKTKLMSGNIVKYNINHNTNYKTNTNTNTKYNIIGSIKGNFLQFLKYGISGGLAFILEYSSFFILNNLAGLWYVWSNSIAMTLGFVLSFLLNRYWSFKATSSNTLKQLLLYGILFGINLGISNLLMMLFIDALGIGSMISKFTTIGILMCWNFIIYKKVIFK
jgi:putative flippase GtrA